DVRIYDRALSPAEIQTDMNTPVSPPVAHEPTTPGNFVATTRTTTSISTSWDPSTDHLGVSGYNMYLNGVEVGASATTSFPFPTLTCGTSSQLDVEAFDGSSNVSDHATQTASTALCAAPTGLVAEYSFDDGSGSVLTDESGNGH